MATFRKIASLILGIAFLLYPMALHSSLATPLDYERTAASLCHNTAAENMLHVDGHSGPLGHHSGNSADADPCYPVSGNACATLASSSPEVGQPAGTFVHENERPATIPENIQTPMPHPPKALG